MRTKQIFIFYIFLSVQAIAQTNELTVRFIANCGIQIADGRSTIYFDFPYKSGFYHYMKYPESEIDSLRPNSVYIFTHKHPDHYSHKVKKVHGTIIVPRHVSRLQKLITTIPDFSIQAFKTKHLLSTRHFSYLVTWHRKRIFVSGDTEHCETITAQKDLDCAFVPVWLILDAKAKNARIDSKLIAVYHIGSKDKIETDNPKVLLLNQRDQIILLK